MSLCDRAQGQSWRDEDGVTTRCDPTQKVNMIVAGGFREKDWRILSFGGVTGVDSCINMKVSKDLGDVVGGYGGEKGVGFLRE